MKFVAIFLACIVAAQAATFACPSYDYWCSHSFHVLPPRHFYCYRVPFNRSWCTTQFYADCLVEYPKHATGLGNSLCPAETPVDDLVAEVTAKLAAARQTIQDKLNGDLAAFESQIDALHAQYIETFTQYLKQCFGENYPELASRIAAYTAELAAAKTAAIAQFNASIQSIMARIQSFHLQLIARYRSCLVNRLARINAFALKMRQRATSFVSQYRARLMAIVEKKVNFVKCVYERLYDGKKLPEEFQAFLDQYRSELQGQVQIDVSAFETEVNAAVEKIIESYRCNSRCVFRTGCFGFSQKSFSRSCVRMPCAPRTSCKLIGVGTFKVDWNGCASSCLRTCTAEQKKCTFDHDSHLKAITAKAVKHIDELAVKVAAWKAQVEEWSKTATSTLCTKVECMMPKTFCGVAPTQAEIDAFRAACRTQAINWVAAKKAMLLAQIDALEQRIIAKIQSWERCSHAFIEKIKAQFDACVAKKNTKIGAYIVDLNARIVAQRACLVARLNKLRTHHKAQFEKFYECAFGNIKLVGSLIGKMRTLYFECVDSKVDIVLAKFDAWWAQYQPRLIEHYTCGIKCSVKVHTPCLRLCYHWNFCAPSLRSCHFYC